MKLIARVMVREERTGKFGEHVVMEGETAIAHGEDGLRSLAQWAERVLLKYPEGTRVRVMEIVEEERKVWRLGEPDSRGRREVEDAQNAGSS